MTMDSKGEVTLACMEAQIARKHAAMVEEEATEALAKMRSLLAERRRMIAIANAQLELMRRTAERRSDGQGQASGTPEAGSL